MTATMATALTAIAAALGVALIAGFLHKSRSGTLRATEVVATSSELDVSDLGLSRTGPTIVHFSAVWCGPCAAVRRVVNQVCAEMRDVAHVEIDMDANPVAARQLSVLSLPTTFIFDAQGKQRYRTSGVPKAADLRAALLPLLA
jgi:thioredoxin-like negative regulator of GroEL